MLSFILILFVCPTTILLISGYIHFRNHFEIKIKRKNSGKHIKNASSTFSSSYKEPCPRQFCKKFKHCFNTLNIIQSKDSDWNFFPVSFIFYLFFLSSLTFIIILKYHNYSYSIINNSCSTSSTTSSTSLIVDRNTDWITLYCLTILNLWESLLNFYRFWTIRECSMLRTYNTMSLLQYYSIYFFIFLILCIIQFHWIYWLFPLLIITHSVYNIFCVVQNYRILMQRYNVFCDPERKALAIANDNMLSSVKTMGFLSLISFILNTILLSLVIGCYNIDIIAYLPLIYSISSFTFSFNFARNRKSLHYISIKIQQIPMKLSKLRICIQRQETDDAEKQSHIEDEHITPICSANDENSDENDQIEKEPNKFMLMVPPIKAKNCQDDILKLTNKENKTSLTNTPITPNTHTKVVYESLTPLLNNSNNKNMKNNPVLVTNKSRSVPSSPLIYNKTNKKKMKPHNKKVAFAETPRVKALARFKQSPVVNWVKQLSLKAGLTPKSDEYTMVVIDKQSTHRQCKSEGVPQFSQYVTHSTSFEDDNNQKLNTNNVLSVFGEDPVPTVSPVSPPVPTCTNSKSKKACDILGIDECNGDDNETFVYVDNNELVNEKFDTDDANFALNIEENSTSGKNELLSFEKWNAFDSLYPANMLRLQNSTSEQQVELYCGNKRNSKQSQPQNRRSSLTTDDMVKAIELEISIAEIKEEQGFEFNGDANKRKSTRKDDEIVAMLELMVQHGFYSKKTFNSVQQLRKYNS